jgi:TM2 domain-containing membrane protein YozV
MMDEIIGFNTNTVLVGHANGSFTEYPSGALNYPGARVGDKVKVYTTGNQVVISRAVPIQSMTSAANMAPGEKVIRINKHLFVWVGNFLFGWIGVDRFMRGQIGLGIVKLLFGWWTMGIWPLVDWIISLVKAYSTFAGTEDLTFVNGRYATPERPHAAYTKPVVQPQAHVQQEPVDQAFDDGWSEF